jgi:succinate dehydrogenase / fumarate reductase, cytochrome b subunit
MRQVSTESRRSTYAKLWGRTLSDRRMGVGSYVWSVHRVTGFILLGYLAAHLVVLGTSLAGGGSFDSAMSILANPGVKVLETLLIWVALLHVINGIRLVALDFAPALNHRLMAYGVGVATVIAGVVITVFMW